MMATHQHTKLQSSRVDPDLSLSLIGFHERTYVATAPIVINFLKCESQYGQRSRVRSSVAIPWTPGDDLNSAGNLARSKTLNPKISSLYEHLIQFNQSYSKIREVEVVAEWEREHEDSPERQQSAWGPLPTLPSGRTHGPGPTPTRT